MHDPTAIFRFEEHDIYIPMTVLEELDAGKKGLSESARNVRQVSRFLDELMQGATEETDRSRPRAAHRGSDQSRQAPSGRPPLLSNAIARIRAPGQPAGPWRGQCHPRQHPGPAAEIPRRAGDAGIEGHQPADQGRDPRRAGRGLLQRQDHRRRGSARQRRAAAAAELLGKARQGHGILAAAEPHLLSGARSPGARMADQSIRLRSRRERRGGHRPQARGRVRDPGNRRRLPGRAQQCMGRHGAQPRAESRVESIDGSGHRFRDSAGARRNGQDAVDAGGRARTDPGPQPLQAKSS